MKVIASHVPHTKVDAAMRDGEGSGWALIGVVGEVDESLVRCRRSVEERDLNPPLCL